MKSLYLLGVLLISVTFLSGCKKEASDEKIRKTLIGTWAPEVRAGADECMSLNWREYKEDGTYAEYYECEGKILDENAGKWRIEDQYLIIRARIFPIDVYYSFYYLSKTQMTIQVGEATSSGTKYNYKKK